MKNLFLGLLVIIMTATSCATFHRTQTSVTTSDVTAPVIAATIADLEVSPQKINYTYKGPATAHKQITLFRNVDELICYAISEALKNYGNADVLVEPQTTIVYKAKGMSKSIPTPLMREKSPIVYKAKGKKKGVESVTVTGYPATYKNFRNADNETLNKAIENGTLLPGSPSIIVNTKNENKTLIRK